MKFIMLLLLMRRKLGTGCCRKGNYIYSSLPSRLTLVTRASKMRYAIYIPSLRPTMLNIHLSYASRTSTLHNTTQISTHTVTLHSSLHHQRRRSLRQHHLTYVAVDTPRTRTSTPTNQPKVPVITAIFAVRLKCNLSYIVTCKGTLVPLYL